MYKPEYLTKSQIFAFDYCPMQFYKRYIEKVRSPPSTEMLIGTRFHEFAEKFFQFTGEVPVENWELLIPRQFEGIERRMAENFVHYEQDRYIFVDGVDYQPYACEWGGTSEDLALRGYIDRIDWVNKDEGTARLVEYKTSKKAKIPQVKQELALYSILFESVCPEYKVENICVYYPYLNCRKEYPLGKREITAVTKKWDKLKAALEKEEFIPNPNEFKCKWCNLCDALK